MAVGWLDGILAEKWDGSDWVDTGIPTSDGTLTGIDCVNANFCMAVGANGVQAANGQDYDQTEVEEWNGHDWNSMAPPNTNPEQNNLLAGVSCVGTNFCMAVGYYVNSSNIQQTLSEEWNGSAWSLLLPLNTSTTENNAFGVDGGSPSGPTGGVSCTSTRFCMAVGRYVDSSGYRQTLAEKWNGHTWINANSQNGVVSCCRENNDLYGVSCTSANFCMAIGEQPQYLCGNDQGCAYLTEEWDGSTWSIIPSSTTLGPGNILTGVSCTAISFCMATGWYGDGYDPQNQQYEWDGATWSDEFAPNTSTDNNALTGVSCIGTSFCTAVGDYRSNTPAILTLTEVWTSAASISPLTAQQDPTEGNAAIPQSCSCQAPSGGFPINTASGAFYHSFTDLSVPGRGIPLNLTRTYSTVFAAQDNPFGYGWTDSYNMSLSVASGTGDVTVSQENGAQVTFTPSGGGFAAASDVAATLSLDSGTGDYLFKRDAQNLYTFNATGQLIKETNLNGYVTTLAYDGSGQLASVADSPGRQLTFNWTGSNITSVTDPLGRTVSYTYDGSGNLATASDPAGNLTTFTYDSGHRLLTMTDARGGMVTNVYDSQGRVLTQTDPMSRTTSYAYSGDNFSAAGGTTTITDPKSDVMVESYQNGLLVSVTYGSGTSSAATWSYAYDPSTLGVIQTIDPNGNITGKTYDSSGNVLTETTPGGRKTTYTYNVLNEPLRITDPLGVTTTMKYDAAGNILSRSTPLSSTLKAVTKYAYGDSTHPGDVTAMTDPNGKKTKYTYDDDGDRTSVTDPLGDKTETTYNVDGWALTVTDPQGKVTTNTYDSRRDLISATDPLGHVTTNAYDADGNQTSVTDALGHTTTSTYDLDGEPTVVTQADGTTQGTGYDADGNVISQTDGLGHATTYSYDPLNHLISMTDPLGRVTTYSYDGVGNLLSTTLPDGQVTSNGYDADNELISISYSDGTTPDVTMSYDGDEQRVQMTDGTGTSTWTWDALHRMTSSTDGAGVTVTCGYDLDGNETSIQYPAGTVTRSYDAADRLIDVTDWLGNTTAFAYDKDGDLTTETFPSATGLVDSYSYNNADELTGIRDKKGSTTIARFGYDRDADGLLTSEKATALPPPTKSTYGYNAINELTTDNSASYAYDAADNITKLTNGASLSYDPGNQLQTMTAGSVSTTYSYDQQGNRISATPSAGTASTYTWDEANRLIDFTSGSTTAAYAYNGDGLRIGKTVNGTLQSFLWDESGSMPLLLFDGTSSYVNGPGGPPLERITGSTALDYHHDQLGSTRLLTDSTGSVVATYTYDPFGDELASTGTVNQPLLFAGQYRDTETGLYYLRARYYDPLTAQFASRDPLAPLTRHPYAYSGNSPVNVVDLSGLLDCGFNGSGSPTPFASANYTILSACLYAHFGQLAALESQYNAAEDALSTAPSIACEQTYESQIASLEEQDSRLVMSINEIGQALNATCQAGASQCSSTTFDFLKLVGNISSCAAVAKTTAQFVPTPLSLAVGCLGGVIFYWGTGFSAKNALP